MNEKWYNDRKTKVEDEAERIVETAAKIILSEIRAIEYRKVSIRRRHFKPG